MKTSEKVEGLRKTDPRITQAEMARRIGVSKERVRQILRKKGMAAVPDPLTATCQHCGKKIHPNRSFCNQECRSTHSHTALICSECGRSYTIRRNVLNSRKKRGTRHNFCSRRCMGLHSRKHPNRAQTARS